MKLSLPKAKPTYINILYRPPDGSITSFLEHLGNDIENVFGDPTGDLVVMGDSNIDILKSNITSVKLERFLKENNLVQIINRPTRITDTTSTLIDHIYVNNKDLYLHRGTLEPGLSDHTLVFACRKRQRPDWEKRQSSFEITEILTVLLSVMILSIAIGNLSITLRMWTEQLTSLTLIS